MSPPSRFMKGGAKRVPQKALLSRCRRPRRRIYVVPAGYVVTAPLSGSAGTPHPAFGHPLPVGEGSRRRVIVKPRCCFIEILLPPGEGARRADEGRNR